MKKQLLFIASDHGGYALASVLVKALRSHAVIWLTPTRINGDDYPRVAKKLVTALQKNHQSLGIALCRSGAGIAIAANKFSGIRAAQAWSVAVAKKIRIDDDANILALGADHVSQRTAVSIAKAFISTPFAKKQRYIRRIREIRSYESRRKG